MSKSEMKRLATTMPEEMIEYLVDYVGLLKVLRILNAIVGRRFEPEHPLTAIMRTTLEGYVKWYTEAEDYRDAKSDD